MEATRRLGFLLASFVLGATPWLAAAAPPEVRFSELHYDNTGTDAGEAIEISGPAGRDVTGWAVVLYNGTGGVTYGTQTLSGAIPATCGARGVLVLNYPVNGLQNGSPDGMALVDASGAVVEFLSYEGAMAATNGPALGLTSIDIGVAEAGTEPLGLSLARSADGSWSGPAANSFGACNDDGPPPPPVEVVSVVVAPTSATLAVGASRTITATALDANSQPLTGIAFTWTSSNTSVATVNAAGVVSAVAVGDATITAAAPNGIGASVAVQVTAPPPPPPASSIRFSEIHYDNAGTDVGEAIEVEAPAGTDLTGYSIVLYDGNGGGVYGSQVLNGLVPATCGARGVLVVNFPVNGLQNGSPDGMALVDPVGGVVEFLAYEGTLVATNGPAVGLQAPNIGEEAGTTPVGASLARNPVNGLWSVGASTFGACNPDVVTPTGNTIAFSGRFTSDPPLPVGFEDQLFATERDPANTVVPTTFTWSSETPDVATIDARGVLRAVSAGTAIVRATATDGTTATYSLPTRIAVASTTASYVGNAEFGEPQDADPSDDYVVRYPQFTASYNPNRGSPNWVSYEIDPSHFGPEDRCDCFTMDPALPSTFTRLTTADYTDAGAFAGYGIDRGHLARSFDRTSASLDNATTFLLSNIVPQASDLNQGPWANFESFLGDLVRFQGKEVYVVTGATGNNGTLKNEGKIVIPTSTWKVAVILPLDRGLASIRRPSDVEVIAVNMPNVPGVRNIDWNTYRTTVDAIEALSGYDLLAALPDTIERAVESGTVPPEPQITAPTGGDEGSALAFSATGSIDPNGTIVSYEWTFGDGASASGADVAHVYAQDGVYTVTLRAIDNDGLTSDVSTTVTIVNVAPVIAALSNGAVNLGTAFVLSGSFSDPGADAWTATVNWGDGSAPTAAAVSGHGFTASHTYGAAGTYTVVVTVADDDASASRTQTVTVQVGTRPLADARTLIDQLVAQGRLNPAAGLVLKFDIAVAEALIARHRTLLAIAALKLAIFDLEASVRLNLISASDAAPLRGLLDGALNSLRN